MYLLLTLSKGRYSSSCLLFLITPFELHEILSFTTLLMPSPTLSTGPLSCPVLVKSQETWMFYEIADAFIRKNICMVFVLGRWALMVWTDDNNLKSQCVEKF